MGGRAYDDLRQQNRDYVAPGSLRQINRTIEPIATTLGPMHPVAAYVERRTYPYYFFRGRGTWAKNASDRVGVFEAVSRPVVRWKANLKWISSLEDRYPGLVQLAAALSMHSRRCIPGQSH
nr:hypothetical protein CFP56_20380 [Quercus suber]